MIIGRYWHALCIVKCQPGKCNLYTSNKGYELSSVHCIKYKEYILLLQPTHCTLAVKHIVANTERTKLPLLVSESLKTPAIVIAIVCKAHAKLK